MKFTVNTFKFKNTYFLALFYILLSILHFNHIIDYQNFNFVAFYREIEFGFIPFRYIIASIVIALNILFLLLFKISDFSYAILTLILFFFVIPNGLFFASTTAVSPEIFVLNNLVFYGVYFGSRLRWYFNFPSLSGRKSLSLLFLITLVGIIPFVIEYGPYVNLKNLLLIDVYNTRSLVAANVDNAYTAYAYSWFSKIIIPVLIIFCIYYEKYWKLIFSVSALIFLYLCGAHKIVFAGIIFLLLFYKYDYLKKTLYFLKVMLALMAMSFIAIWVFEYDYIWQISFRRVLMLPALLNYCYFDFFEGKPLYWSNSFLSGFIEYPYDLKPENLISKIYFNRPKVNANTGIIPDGFKQLGLWGVAINIFIVSLYFSILDSINISPKFFGLFVLLVFSFLNSSLPTILLTHGGILLLIVAMLILRNTNLKMK